MFSSSGIRGNLRTLTPEHCVRLAQTFGVLTEGKRIVVGWDGRLSSPMIARAVVSGLLSVGKEVDEAGLVPMPALSLLVEREYDGGIMVTGSHIPADKNGLKFYTKEFGSYRPEQEKAFVAAFGRSIRMASWEGVGKTKAVDGILFYRRALRKQIRDGRLRVVLDPGNGPQGLVMPALLKEAGYDVTVIHGNIDGRFPGRGPEPRQEVLGALQRSVCERDAAIGIAFDGDGDRAVFVDDRGRVCSGTQIASFLAKERIPKKGTVVTAIDTSRVLEGALEGSGREIYYTPVGSSKIIEAVQEKKASFGFEDNGGFVFPEHQFTCDGGMLGVAMVSLLEESGRKLSDLVDELPSSYCVRERFPLNGVSGEEIMNRFGGRMEKEGMKITSRIDGIKGGTDEAWFLIRPSGTEPILRLVIDGMDERSALQLTKKCHRVLQLAYG